MDINKQSAEVSCWINEHWIEYDLLSIYRERKRLSMFAANMAAMLFRYLIPATDVIMPWEQSWFSLVVDFILYSMLAVIGTFFFGGIGSDSIHRMSDKLLGEEYEHPSEERKWFWKTFLVTTSIFFWVWYLYGLFRIIFLEI